MFGLIWFSEFTTDDNGRLWSCELKCYYTGVAWGQIVYLVRGGLGGSPPPEATAILTNYKENTIFPFGIFELYYNTNVILPLPLNMPDFIS